VIRVADGTHPESPSVQKSKAPVGGYYGTRRTKSAHDNGGRDVNGLDQRPRLVKAFVNPRVELVVWGAIVYSLQYAKSIIDDDEQSTRIP
jgi:hypothetical protein